MSVGFQQGFEEDVILLHLSGCRVCRQFQCLVMVWHVTSLKESGLAKGALEDGLIGT